MLFHRHRFLNDIEWSNLYSRNNIKNLLTKLQELKIIKFPITENELDNIIYRLRDFPLSEYDLSCLAYAIEEFYKIVYFNIFNYLWKHSEADEINNFINSIHSIIPLTNISDNIFEAISKKEDETTLLYLNFKINNNEYSYSKLLEPELHNDYPQNGIPSKEILDFINIALSENNSEYCLYTLSDTTCESEQITFFVVLLNFDLKGVLEDIFKYQFYKL